MYHFYTLKKLVLVKASILFLLCTTTYSQDYVDLVKLNYGTILDAGYKDNDAKTNVELLDFSLVYPIKINEKIAIISGIDYSQHSLSLFPNNATTTLSNITVKAGLSVKHNAKLSGTYVFLPKMSSQDLHTNKNNLFFGGIAILKYQKTAKLQWRFGAYASSEAFGTLVTPIFGIYYLSENKRLEVTANLPINLNLNYNVSDSNSFGVELLTPVKSYNLKEVDNADYYVQVSNIEFGPYFEKRFLDNSLLFRIHAGYSTAEYEVYEQGDVIPFRLSAFEFGDRELLNPETTGSFFTRIGLTYRFHLNKK